MAAVSTSVDAAVCWQAGPMRWVVYGAGAVGGVLGARLYDAGHDVVLVARGEHLRAIRKHGLTLAAPDGTRTLPVPAVASAGHLAGEEPTTVLLAVKSHQTQAAVDDLTVALGPSTPMVCVQNGVANEATLLRFFSDVHGVCVMMPTGHLEPGVVEAHCSPVPGILDVGRFPGGADDTTHRVAQAFRSAGFESEPRPDIMAWKYRKLVMNLGNAVQACCTDGEAAVELADRARAEGEAVLHAAGVPVVSVERDRERRGSILQVGEIPGRGRRGGSTWQSLRRGTGTVESDYLNGEVVLLGRLHGRPTPVNELLRRTALQLSRDGAEPGSLDAAELLRRLD
jgi:2-dehydropantoate 2-reductase